MKYPSIRAYLFTALILGLTHTAAQVPQTPHPTASQVTNQNTGWNNIFFVQDAKQGGTIIPKTGQPGIYTLTLKGLENYTVYFKNGPQIDTGLILSEDFARNFNKNEDYRIDPPNASLVLASPLVTLNLVIELLSSKYDNISRQQVYDIRFLNKEAPKDLPVIEFDEADLYIVDLETSV